MGVLIFYKRRGGHILSTILNVAALTCLWCSPIFTMANPKLASSGRVNLITQIYNAFGICGMMGAGLYFSDIALSLKQQIGTTFLFLFALGYALHIIAYLFLYKKEYRWMQYKHFTIRDHFRTHVWKNIVKTNFGPTLEDSRAVALTEYDNKYWDRDLVRAWLSKNWYEWEALPPPWFTLQWKRLIPDDYLPDGVSVEKKPSVLSSAKTALGKTFRNLRTVPIDPPLGESREMR